MAISNADRRLLVLTIIECFGEGGYPQTAQVIRYLTARFPAIAWETELRTQAAVAFGETGLSVTWWCDEVMRLSQP